MEHDPIIHVDDQGKAWRLSEARAHLEDCAGTPPPAPTEWVGRLQAELNERWAFMRRLMDADIKVLPAQDGGRVEVWTMSWNHLGPRCTPHHVHMYVIVGSPATPLAAIHERVGRDFDHVVSHVRGQRLAVAGARRPLTLMAALEEQGRL